jgi:hypothetical protein
MPGYPPKKIYANSYNPNRRYNPKEKVNDTKQEQIKNLKQLAN